VEALEADSSTPRLTLQTIENRGAKAREVRILLEVPEDAISLRLNTRFIEQMPLAEMSSTPGTPAETQAPV
jgi:hypothetical protein